MKICSWNAKNLSLSSKRNFAEIQQKLAEYDLIALQEIRDPRVVPLIAKSLSFWVSPPVGSAETSAHQTGKRKEFYAFIWSKNISLCSEPCIIDGNTSFVRPPAIGFFRFSSGFDFVFSTIHVVWGKKKDRVCEIDRIKVFLAELKNVCNTCGSIGEKNIILCGDFNTPAEKMGLDGGWFHCIDRGTVCGSGSCYDNFWISSETHKPISATVCDTSFGSDHFPIEIILPPLADDDFLQEIDLRVKI